MEGEPSDPLVLTRHRRWAWAVMTVSALVGWFLGVAYVGTEGPGRLDAVVDPALAVDSPTWRRVLWTTVVLGEPLVMVALAGAMAVGSLVARRVSAAVLAVVGPGLAAALAYVLQPVVGRTLDGIDAYPSGHTVTAAAIATVALVLVIGARRRRFALPRAAMIALITAVPVTVAGSLVALRLHYTTDVIGGACISVAVVLAVALTLDTIASGRNARDVRVRPGGREP